MNQKIAFGFLTGVILASGVSYFVVHRAPAPPEQSAPPALAEAPSAPAPPPLEEPAVAPPKPAPPKIRPLPATRASAPAPEPAAPPRSQPAPEPAPVAPIARAPLPPLDPLPAVTSPQTSARPREPNTVTLASGTSLSVRLSEGLSTERNRPGDTFSAVLDQPLVIDDFVIAERGARVEGKITEAQVAGRVRGLAQLSIQLTRLYTADGQSIPIRTATYVQQGPESKGEDAAKVGIGAALGAIIGAAAGGGKGAGIGAAAGGAAGAGTVAATRGKPAVLTSETRLTFRIDQPVTVTEQLR